MGPRGMTRKYNLKLGEAHMLNGIRVSYLGRAGQEPRAHQFRDDYGMVTVVSDEELRDLRRLGRLRAPRIEQQRRQELTRRGRQRLSVVWEKASVDDRKVAQYRRAYVDRWKLPETDSKGKPIIKTQGDTFLQPVINEIYETEPRPESVTNKPATRTLRRWIHLYNQHGLDGLLPRYDLSGNFNERFDPTTLLYMQKGVDKFYLTDARRSIVQAHELFRTYMDKVNGRRKEEGEPALRVPGLRAFARFIDGQCPFETAYTRVGAEAARRQFHAVTGGVTTTRHDERWEVDHTQLNVLVRVTPNGSEKARPWITAVIDCHTRMIVGFWIGFEAPSVETTCRALRMAILPKDEWMARYGQGLRNPYPCEGAPTYLCSDQGTDFKAADLRTRVSRLRMSTLFTPVLKPYYRARIERWFLTVDKRLTNTLPGSVNSNIAARDVEMLATNPTPFSLDDIWRTVFRWIVDVYHRRFHRGIGTSPLRAYYASLEQHGDVLPPSDQEVDAALSWCGSVMLNRQGLRIRNIYYQDATSVEFFQAHGESVRVPVYRKPTDLMRCYFLDPRDGQYKEVSVAANQIEEVRGRTEEDVAMLRRLTLAQRVTDDSEVREAEAELFEEAEEKAADDGFKRRDREQAAAEKSKMKKQSAARFAHSEAVAAASADAITGANIFGLGVEESASMAQPAAIPARARPTKPRQNHVAKPPAAAPSVPQDPSSDDDDDLDAYKRRYGLD